ETDRARRHAARRLRARAVELLVESETRTARIVLSAAGAPEETLPERVAVLHATGEAEALEDVAAGLEATVPLIARNGEVLWLVVAPGSAERLAAGLRERGLLVGVGDPVALGDADRSHANAGHALRAATQVAPVVLWERLVRQGAMGVLDGDRAAAFAASYLDPIAGDEELVRTLQSFLRHHGSRLKVAAELGVHRNTVRNRLEQIETGLDASLDDPQTRVSAWVALQVVAGST
ncbi:MAG: helix-turn-helix domain-containing protein, partial [Nocardioides sp.]